MNIVKDLVNNCDSDPHCTDNDNDTPLCSAAQFGNLELVSYLANDLHCDPNCMHPTKPKELSCTESLRTPMNLVQVYVLQLVQRGFSFILKQITREIETEEKDEKERGTKLVCLMCHLKYEYTYHV